MTPQKPKGYESMLSDYQVVAVDAFCGEPVAWGFKIIAHLGEELFENLRQYGSLKCIDMGKWVLVVKSLTRAEAEEKYGPVTEEIFGPRGGWKSVTFGEKKFSSEYLRPERN